MMPDGRNPISVPQSFPQILVGPIRAAWAAMRSAGRGVASSNFNKNGGSLATFETVSKRPWFFHTTAIFLQAGSCRSRQSHFSFVLFLPKDWVTHVSM
jgi:hypothetical protein